MELLIKINTYMVAGDNIIACNYRYSGQLKGKKSTWVQEAMFHHKEVSLEGVNPRTPPQYTDI